MNMIARLSRELRTALADTARLRWLAETKHYLSYDDVFEKWTVTHFDKEVVIVSRETMNAAIDDARTALARRDGEGK